MPPTGSETDGKNFDLIVQLGVWAKRDGTGKGFGSSGGFILPNGAVRSPDVAWIEHFRWEAIPVEQRRKFAPICPDFVVELCSETDSLSVLQKKMQEYIDNGAALGWLIDCQQQKLYVCRPATSVEALDNRMTVSGNPVLPRFILDLSRIW